jgi:hypothetical protein
MSTLQEAVAAPASRPHAPLEVDHWRLGRHPSQASVFRVGDLEVTDLDATAQRMIRPWCRLPSVCRPP